MTLPTLSADQLREALISAGIEHGDGLLIHSALQFFGQPDEGQNMYLQVIEDILGEEGTLAVPAFTFAFARGEAFDPDSSPSEEMGVFSELVRMDERSLRSRHPMQSLALLGKNAQDLASLDTPSAFDDGSAYDRMLKLDFKLLLLGADIQAASIVHYCEQRSAVPYRYWKEFGGKVFSDGEWKKRNYRMFVRDLEMNPKLALAPIQAQLEQDGKWHSVPVNFGHVAHCRLSDFVRVCDALLAEDPWALVANKASIKI